MSYFDYSDPAPIDLPPRVILKLRIFQQALNERKETIDKEARYWNRQDLLKVLLETTDDYHEMLMALARDLEEHKQVAIEIAGRNWEILTEE